MDQRRIMQESKKLRQERINGGKKYRVTRMFGEDDPLKEVHIPTEREYANRRKMPITGYQLMFPDEKPQKEVKLQSGGINFVGIQLGNVEIPQSQTRIYISPKKVHDLSCKNLLNQQYATDNVTNTHILNYMQQGPAPSRKNDKLDLQILKEEKEKNPKHVTIVRANLDNDGDLDEKEKNEFTELSMDYLTELENKHEQPNRDNYMLVKDSTTPVEED